MNKLTSPFGNITIEQFLRDYWQKKPLLVRKALPDFVCPVEPGELAGLACEEGVESRIVLEKDGKMPWELRHGPFKESDFTSMPASHWTVLVQEINKHVPEFALLQERFRFLPNWRLDDVMVSFAQDQGTVGPHIDNYDVFLIQGPGQRRWQISHQPGGPEHLIPGMPLRILKEFKPEQEWVLDEGDLLYLPPGVAHHGVALGDCITISVGYRAPAIQEILGAYMADMRREGDGENLRWHRQYKADITPADLAVSPAEIDAAYRALDPKVLEELVHARRELVLIGDKLFNDADLEDRLWRTRRIHLLPLRKDNQKLQWPDSVQHALGRVRHRIETVFSTLTTVFNIQRPRGRSLAGHVVRIATCILAHTLSFFVA